MLLKILRRFSLLLILPLFFPIQVFATTVSSSSNYQVDQVSFGAGGSDSESSSNYQAQATVGDLGTCSSSSTHPTTITPGCNSTDYGAYAGFDTTSDPFLEMVVTNSNVSLGVLSASSTSTANGTFYIRAWQAHSYVVQTVSPPPENVENSYALHNLSTPTSSTAGTEQFGMNLVANTLPTTFGTAPQQTTTFSYGQPTTNYDTANKYTYNQGDIIASCSSSTSSTIYTLSYIFNINGGTTPSGSYNFNEVLVATATY
jgi:hypothetical protein